MMMSGIYWQPVTKQIYEQVCTEIFYYIILKHKKEAKYLNTN